MPPERAPTTPTTSSARRTGRVTLLLARIAGSFRLRAPDPPKLGDGEHEGRQDDEGEATEAAADSVRDVAELGEAVLDLADRPARGDRPALDAGVRVAL